ncbi:ABC transporter substrate-binding protein [Sphingomonas sp.]|jgi:iron complex transport system substrate-binding protein|uniref:ABC transporter substrate-binding protein n=1 Tax=Sphingomonas sp. TaxID=28214 RepID=UPI003B3B70F0
MLRPLACLFFMLAAAAQSMPPRRVASINLCADQYLVALADPGQISGLTRLSHRPDMSPIAAEAARFPAIGASAETLLAHRPDLLLTGWPGQADAAIHAGLTSRILVLPPANSYADIKTQVRLVAQAVGHPERGEALIRRMDKALAAIPKSGRNRVAADYQRRGYLSGGGTLMDEMMRRVGLVNLATKLHRPALSNLSLEDMVAARPDFLITGGKPARDIGSAMLDHPAIADIPRLYLPGQLADCGGPSYPQAIRTLSDQLRQKR